MLKKTALIFCCFAMINTATAENVQKNKYLKFSVGIPIHNYVSSHDIRDFKFIPSGSMVFGKKLSNSNINIELEGTYHYLSGKCYSLKTDVSIINGFINAVWFKDIKNSNISPYMGLGVGVSHTKTTDIIANGQIVFAGGDLIKPIAQWFIGADYKYNSKLSFIGDIRYTYLGKIRHKHVHDISSLAALNGVVNDGKIQNISIICGIKYKF